MPSGAEKAALLGPVGESGGRRAAANAFQACWLLLLQEKARRRAMLMLHWLFQRFLYQAEK
jgi:hypothetical protein